MFQLEANPINVILLCRTLSMAIFDQVMNEVVLVFAMDGCQLATIRMTECVRLVEVEVGWALCRAFIELVATIAKRLLSLRTVVLAMHFPTKTSGKNANGQKNTEAHSLLAGSEHSESPKEEVKW
jgi:hypothetical protein